MANIQSRASDATAAYVYTCNTCQVAYRSTSLQKGHMKSDWHRYNLKRRVASLPPIPANIFTEKVLEARAESSAAVDKAYFERTCAACSKTYLSENAYQNHLSSQRHHHNEAVANDSPEDENRSLISSTFSLGEPLATSKQGNTEDEFNQAREKAHNSNSDLQSSTSVKNSTNPSALSEIAPGGDTREVVTERTSISSTPSLSMTEPVWTIQTCIFCNFRSQSMPLNVSHMERLHGMFVPEKPYLTDLDGLIGYLHRKVGDDHECLYCGKVKSTVYAVQTHMKDKGHCKIPFTSEEDQLAIGEYYDFRSTYSDEEEDPYLSSEDLPLEQVGGAKHGTRPSTHTVKSNRERSDSDDEDSGWETESVASSVNSEDISAVSTANHTETRNFLRKPENLSHSHKSRRAVLFNDYELHLPSGKSVGHRSFNRYYRQNLNRYPSPQERAEREAMEIVKHGDIDEAKEFKSHDKRNRAVTKGSMSLTGISDQQKEKLRKVEQHGRNHEISHSKKTALAYSKKLNKYKGYYYRYVGGG